MKLIDSIIRQPARISFSTGTTGSATATVGLDSVRDAETVTVSADDGSFVVLPAASGSVAGVLTAAEHAALLGLEAARHATRAAAEAAVIPAGRAVIRTDGYATPADGGGALYRRVAAEPAHAGKLQSADGAWWELRSDWMVNVRQFGARGDGSTDDAAAFQGAIAYHTNGETVTIVVPEGSYSIGTPLVDGARAVTWVFNGEVSLSGAGSTLPGSTFTWNALSDAEQTKIADAAVLSSRNVFEGYTPAYDLGANSLSVQHYMNAGTHTMPAGEVQHNIIRMEGDFTVPNADDGLKGLAFTFTIESTDLHGSGYGVIGSVSGIGNAEVKALYGRGITESGAGGIAVGVVAAAQSKPLSAPSVLYGLQISMDVEAAPSGSANAINADTALAGGSELDHGLVFNDKISFSNAMLKGFNDGAGSCLKWQNTTGVVLLQINKEGDITHRKADGARIFGTNAGGVNIGEAGNTQRGVFFFNSSRAFALSAIDTGDYLRINDTGVGADVARFYGNNTTNAVYIRVGGALKNVSEGAADSAGAGFRQLRVPN